jgi:hypothetical protein
MQNWIDIGGAEELSAAPLRRIMAMNREFAVSYKDGQFGVLFQIGVITQADHSAKVALMANTLSAPGTIGNFTGVMGKVNLASKTIMFLPTQSRSRAAVS